MRLVSPKITPLPSESPNEKIPAHVWRKLSDCGEKAAERLCEMLSDEKFHKLRGSDKTNLIRMAFEYAYGKPDAPLKRSVNLNLSSDNSDAVQSAMAKLAAAVPEYDAATIDNDTGEISPAGSD